MRRYKAILATSALVLVMSATAPAPAWAFGHGTVPAGQCAQSDIAVDNLVAQAHNPFSDTRPIPAKAGGFIKDGPAKPQCEKLR